MMVGTMDLNEHMYGSSDDKNRSDLVSVLDSKTAGILALLQKQPEDKIVRVLALHSPFVSAFLTVLADTIHADNVKAGWWNDPRTGEDLHGKRNVPEMLMLIVSEVSEAMEAYRKKLPDDKLPHRPGLKVELIDALIRIFDLLGSEGNEAHPAGMLFEEKRTYNRHRADHKPENRLKEGGKLF